MANASRRKAVSKDSDLVDHEESFVKLGTPLPSLTSSKADQNEFVPVWKQEVTDEQGRRRLHGAFTGGFSAGYFNTVGSKEGWNPKTFKSSRNDKKATEKGFNNQRPEDFMDEEDLAELAQSKELETNSVFASSSVKSSYLNNESYDPLTGTVGNVQLASDPLQQLSRPSAAELVFSDFVQPNNMRAGYQIMKKMGWRDGQGIGPRVTHERRMLLASKIGIDLNSDMDLEEDPERKKHLFAPIDRPLREVQSWPGFSGLGHSYSTFPQSSDPLPPAGPSHLPSTSATKDQVLKIPQGSSFGLGALNDTEDDDQDIYGSASDQVTSDPRARRLLNLSEAGPSKKSSSVLSVPKAPDGRVDRRAKVFQDNTNLPEGFCLCASVNNKNHASTSYSPPKVPETWKPSPKQIWENASKSSSQAARIQPTPRHTNRPINADDRARLIGEQAPTRSIFDYISSKDKARLEDAKQLASRSKISNQESGDHEKLVPGTLIVIPKLDPVIAKSALSGFVPFSHDPAKQDRYKLYLQSQAGILPAGTRFAPKVTKDQTLEVINKELDGFAKSAMMFKPMSAMMASRFTTAGSSTTGGELAAPEPGLRQPVFLDEPSEPIAPPEETHQEPKLPVSQADQAVQIDMFGQLTRTIKEFYPQKLLCKRFNVPNPFPDGPPVEPTPKSSSKNLTEFLVSSGFQPATSTAGLEQNNPWLRKEDQEEMPLKSINQVGLGGDETQGRGILTSSRPSLDLFKAIFGNDEEDEKSLEDLDSNNPDLNNNNDDLLNIPPKNSDTLLPPPKNLNSTSDLAEVNSHQVVSLTPVVVDPKAVEKLSSFRPTFSLKNQTKEEEEITDVKNHKKGMKKNKRPVLISFDDDENDEGPAEGVKNNDSKKKKNKKKKKVQADHAQMSVSHDNDVSHAEVSHAHNHQVDDDDWVEAVLPPPPPPPPPSETIKNTKLHPKFRRMKASDLMD